MQGSVRSITITITISLSPHICRDHTLDSVAQACLGVVPLSSHLHLDNADSFKLAMHIKMNWPTYWLPFLVAAKVENGVAFQIGIAFQAEPERSSIGRTQPTNHRICHLLMKHDNILVQRYRWSLRSTGDENEVSPTENVPTTELSAIVLGVTLIAVSFLVHADGWSHLYSSFQEMKSNSSPSEFSSAFQFWLFGALSHPLLKPIFGVSEIILHASPGPKLAGLVPIFFAAVSACVAWVLVEFELLRNLAGAIAMALLINSIGVGLDGKDTSLLGDNNIQLDDAYRGQVVKGCPAPDGDALSRNLPGDAAFDYQRYKGKWYWHKVHDWTQFQEMYDTSLDIRLTDSGYINTLNIKGPSPLTSPLSWDKSPLMNGVKYSWVGSVDKNSPPGTSLESGFGVVFPNYIVDVKTDDKGNYSELIQFQCIEVGGVRLYEGIDFMSRSPEMSDEELQLMHQRANAAGLDPYGSSPQQMHRVEHSDSAATTSRETNEWQQLWKRLEIEKYLDQSLK